MLESPAASKVAARTRRGSRRRSEHLNRLDYIHTKLMIVDPLTSDPLIVTGSANWSDESSKINDENMLIIRGDLRATDIYLTDFTAPRSTTTGCAARRRRPTASSCRRRGSATADRAKVHLARRTTRGRRRSTSPASPEAKERMLFSAAPGEPPCA